MTEHVDVIIAGAGVIGLAIARTLAVAGHDVVVAEAEAGIGTGISSRNSEVIHAGIYYPKNSLKAKLCVRGRELLYRYCETHNVPFRRIGKFITATTADEIAALAGIGRRAAENGVDNLCWKNGAEMRHIEPELNCVAALHSPSTGILDSHSFMLSLQSDAEAAGAVIAFCNPIVGGTLQPGSIRLFAGGDTPSEITCNWFVNAAGLGAIGLASSLADMPGSAVPRAWFCKGHYLSLRGRSPFSHLIYPVPEAAGLGVHLTLDLAGRARFGPDTAWIDRAEYGVDAGALRPAFAKAIRRYWPNLEDEWLEADYAGVRPKISGPNEGAADFRIEGPATHGVEGLINLFGIESPGLTSSLAIAELVGEIVASRARVCP